MSEAPIDTVERVIRTHRYVTDTESDLQAGLSEALAPFEVEREVVLGPRDRVDFMLWGVGIEVKIQGGISPLTRQLHRYAQHERIKALLVVTTREQYRLQLPSSLNGKPLRVVSLLGGLA